VHTGGFEQTRQGGWLGWLPKKTQMEQSKAEPVKRYKTSEEGKEEVIQSVTDRAERGRYGKRCLVVISQASCNGTSRAAQNVSTIAPPRGPDTVPSTMSFRRIGWFDRSIIGSNSAP
jgi:hypothetical protein